MSSYCCSGLKSNMSHYDEIRLVISPPVTALSTKAFLMAWKLPGCFTLIPMTYFNRSLISTSSLTCFPARTPFCRAQADSVLRPFTTAAPGTRLKKTQQGLELLLFLSTNTQRWEIRFSKWCKSMFPL